MLSSFTEFADYVWDFYSPKSDLYPMKDLTMENVFAAIYEYKQRLLKVSYNNPEYVKAFGKNYSSQIQTLPIVSWMLNSILKQEGYPISMRNSHQLRIRSFKHYVRK